MAYTVAITNQKGGVGKTTTAVNLAAAIAIAERRTLLVDADPQGNTTSGVGIAKLELQVSLYDVLVEGHSVQDVILPVPGLPYLSVLPATQDLVGAELQLVERPFRESALRRVLEPIERDYDYIIVDCPPSLGLLTLNVLAAVQAVIIPIQCEYYGLEGISQLLNTVRLVQQNINPGLAIGGVLLTMYDSRLNLCRQVAEDATEYFGPKVFGTPIPRNVRLAEAPSFGKPILLYDMQSVGAKSYLAVGQELLRRIEGADATVMPGSAALAAGRPASAEPPQMVHSRSTEGQAAESHVADAEAAGTRGSEEQTVDVQVAEAQAGENQNAETPATEPRVSDAQVADGQVADGQVADGQVGKARPAEARDAEAQDAEARDAEARDVEARDAEARIAEVQVVENQSAESQAAESQAAEPRAAEPEPQVSEPQVAELPPAERQAPERQATEPQAAASQATESRAPESPTTQSQIPESDAVEPKAIDSQFAETRVAESWIVEPQPSNHESIGSQPLESESTMPPQSMAHAESSDFDEPAQSSKPPSQHLPEVTT